MVLQKWCANQSPLFLRQQLWGVLKAASTCVWGEQSSLDLLAFGGTLNGPTEPTTKLPPSSALGNSVQGGTSGGCVGAAGKMKGRQEVPGTGQSPYLVRPHRAGGDLLNGQGLLQLRAPRGAVVAAAARPGSPATRDRDWVTRGHPCGCLLELREDSGSHLQSHTHGKQRPPSAAAMSPRRESPEGRGPGQEERTAPAPPCRVRGRKRDRPRPGTRPEPGGQRCQDAPRASPPAGLQGPRGARPLSRRLPGGGAHWQGKKSRPRKTIIRDDAFVGVFIANLGAF